MVFWLVCSAPGAVAKSPTYRILDYSVEIEPRPDGSWSARYSQEWEVTGGSVPWVTVGLPHSGYEIVDWGGDARHVRRGDEGSWSGAYVELNRDYRKGQRFRFEFGVIQRKMGYRKADAVEFSFVPGWYDDAETDRLAVHLKNPWSPEDLLFTSPAPSEKTADEAVWTARLGAGERFKVSFAFSPGVFTDLEEGRAGTMPGGRGTGDEMPGAAPFIVLIVLVLVTLLIVNSLMRRFRRSYRGRRGIFYGAMPIFPPVGVPHGSKTVKPKSDGSKPPPQGGSRKTGGGGGFGGRSVGCACVSCACACVSCACACACAGGRGAGCARKFVASPPKRAGHIDTDGEKVDGG